MPHKLPKTKAAAQAKMGKVMHEAKAGQLHSGSKTGPIVKSRAQAIAIGLNESGQGHGQKFGPHPAGQRRR